MWLVHMRSKKEMKYYIIILTLIIFTFFKVNANVFETCSETNSGSEATQTNNPVSDAFYPESSKRSVSDENITYYIDPVNGSDENTGTSRGAPWKTFLKINQLILTKGDKIEIVTHGTFRESLFLIGQGTKKSPVTVHFARGKYNFYPQKAFKSKFFISNTNDAPDSLKSVAFYFLDCKNVQVKADGAEIVFRGKTMNAGINHCENISIEGFDFDYFRPTVSEMRVLNIGEHFADVEIHKDSKYEIIDSTLIWLGEGWSFKVQNYWQEVDPVLKRVKRKSMNSDKMTFFETGENRIKIRFGKNPGFVQGDIYQNRNTFRDYAAVFMQNSKNISWKNTHVYFMHGLGFVSQFCENITFDSLVVKPRGSSGRTSSAWADVLHFSGCKGKILIANSYLSAMQDDAVNVHGTHLRIAGVIAPKKIKVRFMHPQTYGFDAFFVGDSIEFINARNLLPYFKNQITQVEKLNDKEFELTLNRSIPINIQPGDVIENSTRTPDVTIRNVIIIYTPTRGILVTTKGEVVIENSEFIKTTMSSVLIADDANSWFESGYVRNVTIRNNKFIECASPVIYIHPENKEIIKDSPVHKNIEIVSNLFKLPKNLLLSAKSTGGIRFFNNVIEVNKHCVLDDLLHFKACIDVEVKGNKIKETVVNSRYKKNMN